MDQDTPHLIRICCCVTALLLQHPTQEEAVTNSIWPSGCGITYHRGLKRIRDRDSDLLSTSKRMLRTDLLVMLPFFLIVPQHRICVSSCPPGHYHADKKRCRKCAPNCESCFGSHGDQCLSCKHGYFLNEETNSCVTHCPDGSYQDTSELISNIWILENKCKVFI